MSKWLTDNVKIDLYADPIGGCTAVRYTPYYDMRGYESIDFVVSSPFAGSSNESTAKQNISVQVYKATGSTGGGATAIATATGVASKTATSCDSVCHGKSLMIEFTTRLTHASTGTAFSIAGQKFISATGNSAAYCFNGFASAAASVAAAGFVTSFNAVTCTLSSAWVAELAQASTTVARVIIKPRSETAVPATYHLTATVGTAVGGVGVPSVGVHVAVKTEQLKDGYRYVALGFSQSGASLVASTVTHHQPVSITVLRTVGADAPVVSTAGAVQYSKRLAGTSV